VAERKRKQSHGLQSEIISLTDLLTGPYFFVMPFMQRPYEWSSSEVSELIGDLLAACEAKYKNYVLGHIIGLRGSRGEMLTVDGQQRLVTLTILFAYLRDRLAGRSSALDADINAAIMVDGRPRVLPRPVDAPFLRDLVQARDSGPRLAAALADAARGEKGEKGARANDPQALMLNAARVVRENLDRFAMEPLQRIAEFVMERTVVNFIIADDRSDASILFRSMNMRGRRELSAADLMKLEVIEFSGLSEKVKEKVARRWEQIEDDVGRTRFEELIAQAPLLVEREPVRQPGNLEEWSAKTFRNVSVEFFVLNMLPQYATIMTELLAGDIRSECRTAAERQMLDETNSLLRGILFLRERYWLAPAIAYVYAHREDHAAMLRFFKGLDRLCYACFLEGVRSDARPRRFARVVAAGGDETQLEAAFALEEEEKKKMSKRLRQPWHRLHWRRRAIATRVAAAFPGGRNFGQYEDITVEHVLPASFCDVWEREGWTEERAEYCCELLGNLVLVTEKQNGRANQKSFPAKKSIYYETKDAAIHPITEDLRHVQRWTEAELLARHERLARMLLACWGIDD
jgi:hypothetical protein